MLQTFFFVPANRIDFLRKSMSLKADNIIIDFEDAVPDSETIYVINNFEKKFINKDSFARVTVVDSKTGLIDGRTLEKIIELGFRKIILPKISTVFQLEEIAKVKGVQNCMYCILVENPVCLINLQKILHSKKIAVSHVALGSHDYANSMGMEHVSENIYFARNYVLNYARAYNVQVIDIASMDIHASFHFEKECMEAVSLGFDGKFILHPDQLSALERIKFFSDEEIKRAENVYNHIKDVPFDELSVIEVDGVLYEKPHINRIMKIVDWNKNYGRK